MDALDNALAYIEDGVLNIDVHGFEVRVELSRSLVWIGDIIRFFLGQKECRAYKTLFPVLRAFAATTTVKLPGNIYGMLDVYL